MKLELNEARQFFADLFLGEHHLPSKIKPWGEGWYVYTRPGEDFATTDYNKLTRMVILAHERGIRASIAPHNIGRLKIILHKRDPLKKELGAGHPTLEQAVAAFKQFQLDTVGNYTIVPEHASFVTE